MEQPAPRIRESKAKKFTIEVLVEGPSGTLEFKKVEASRSDLKELMETTELVPNKTSKYNQQLYINKCGIPGCHNNAELTHHINFQCEADSSGYIHHNQKNHRSNLLPLCRQCHNKIHNPEDGEERYLIKGYIMTSNGLELDYETIKSPKVEPKVEPKEPSKFKLKLRK